MVQNLQRDNKGFVIAARFLRKKTSIKKQEIRMNCYSQSRIAGHRRAGRRASVADGHHRAGAADAVRRAAGVPPVAKESFRGEGSIAMLERLLPALGRQGVRAGAAGLRRHRLPDHHDAVRRGRHRAPGGEPVHPRAWGDHYMLITLILLALLAAVFLRGFSEAIGIAVGLVAVYLALNLVVVVVGLEHVITAPSVVADWKTALTTNYSSPLDDGRDRAAGLPQARAWPLRLRDRGRGDAAGGGHGRTGAAARAMGRGIDHERLVRCSTTGKRRSGGRRGTVASRSSTGCGCCWCGRLTADEAGPAGEGARLVNASRPAPGSGGARRPARRPRALARRPYPAGSSPSCGPIRRWACVARAPAAAGARRLPGRRHGPRQDDPGDRAPARAEAAARRGGRALLVVPASLIANWTARDRAVRAVAARSGRPSFAMPSRTGADIGRADLAGVDLVITTYGMLVRDALARGAPMGARRSSTKRRRSRTPAPSRPAVKALTRARRIALTGTPVENRLGDLWSLFDFLNPGLLGTAESSPRSPSGWPSARPATRRCVA